ncbi:hypothetical protein SJ900_15875 [Enterococcus faecium]|nr:hypothetical protein BZK37_18015 [Enterococcus casseliflavus]
MNDSIKKMLRIINKDLMIAEVFYDFGRKRHRCVVFLSVPRVCRSYSTILAIAHFNQYNMSQWLCAKKSNAIFVKIVEPIDLIKTILSVTNI